MVVLPRPGGGGGHTGGGPCRRAARIGLLLIVAAMAVACTTTVPGTPVASGSVVTKPSSGSGVDPKFVHNTDGGDIDTLAATVVTDVLDYWRDNFPATFGKPWTDLSGGFFSVDTADVGSPAPPCARRAI